MFWKWRSSVWSGIDNRSHRTNFCPVELASYLRAWRKPLVFTGAGISAGHGIPDFWGPHGVWTRRQPEAARIEHWDYKLEVWEPFRSARPNSIKRDQLPQSPLAS